MPNLSSIDKFSDSDSLVVYQRNGAVMKGTVATLVDHVQSKITVPADSAIYDTASYVEQSNSTYLYFAWARIDGTGYKAERWNFTAGQSAGIATGPLPIPADLTALIYE